MMAENQTPGKLRIHLEGTVTRCEVLGVRWQCFEFMDSNKTLSDNPPAPSSPAETSVDLRPVVLPNEIVLRILKYLDVPYKLQGRMICVRGKGLNPIINFYNPRQWASIPALQICGATRSRAIERYGSPSEHSLPFDGNCDSLEIRVDVSQNMVSDIRQLRADFDLNASATHRTTLSNSVHSRSDYRKLYQRFLAQEPAKELDLTLHGRAQCVEIEATNESGLSVDDWESFAGCLFDWPSLNTLCLKFRQPDAHRPKTLRPETPCAYKNHLSKIVIGFTNSLYDFQLTVIEMEKTKARCREGATH